MMEEIERYTNFEEEYTISKADKFASENFILRTCTMYPCQILCFNPPQQ